MAPNNILDMNKYFKDAQRESESNIEGTKQAMQALKDALEHHGFQGPVRDHGLPLNSHAFKPASSGQCSLVQGLGQQWIEPSEAPVARPAEHSSRRKNSIIEISDNRTSSEYDSSSEEQVGQTPTPYRQPVDGKKGVQLDYGRADVFGRYQMRAPHSTPKPYPQPADGERRVEVDDEIDDALLSSSRIKPPHQRQMPYRQPANGKTGVEVDDEAAGSLMANARMKTPDMRPKPTDGKRRAAVVDETSSTLKEHWVPSEPQGDQEVPSEPSRPRRRSKRITDTVQPETPETTMGARSSRSSTQKSGSQAMRRPPLTQGVVIECQVADGSFEAADLHLSSEQFQLLNQHWQSWNTDKKLTAWRSGKKASYACCGCQYYSHSTTVCVRDSVACRPCIKRSRPCLEYIVVDGQSKVVIQPEDGQTGHARFAYFDAPETEED